MNKNYFINTGFFFLITFIIIQLRVSQYRGIIARISAELSETLQ